MVVKIPEQHYFPDFLKREVLEKTGYNLPDWEISVPRKDDIVWSVILSFLTSTDHRNRNDFSRRLFALTGCNRNNKNLNLVKNAIKTFNPFRNRFSCFYNEALQQVVAEFKVNIGWNSSLRRISSKLFAVSQTLGCRILHIWRDKYAFRYNIYSETSKNKLNTIFILSSDYTNEEHEFSGCVCNFLLDHEMGIGLKYASLRYFLKEAEIPRKILNKVVEHVEEEDHFLISLLRSDYQDVISTLYSSSYLVSKLAEAGFETDPRTADSSGFSAFHHALALGKIEILYKMYYFSANNYYQTEESYGSPESRIVNNLQQLEKIFSNDLAKFETSVHPSEYPRIKKEYNDFIRFNKFLLEINSNLVKIKSRLNSNSIKDTVFEASKRRDIILCILDTYKRFFLSDPQETVIQSCLDDYIKFRNYYNSIDLETAILFFSNIIYLKERLALENENTFSQMEISFYQTIYFKYFSGTTPCEEYLKEKLNSHTIFFIPLIRRLENLENINEFSTNLRDTIITEKNVIKYVPEREILSIFKSFPIFKNVIHLNRLKYYIDTALKIKVVDEKSVLVIQRVLQVIGEYVNPNHNDTSEDDGDFQRFISLILPKNVCHVLLCIRNKLSHLQSYELKLKFECETEKNFPLFRSIQKEIDSIYHSFNLVYNFYVWKESLEFLKFTEQDKCTVRKLKNANDNPYQLASTFNEVDYRRLRIETFILYRSSYIELFEIVLHSVDNKINDEIEWTGDWKQTKKDIIHVLWPLKRLFGVLSENDSITDSPLTNIVEALILVEKNMDLNILKRKFDKSIRECKDLLSRLENETPLRETPLTDMKNTEYAVYSTLSYESDISKTIITNEENIDLLNDLKYKTDEIIGKCLHFLSIVMKLRKSSSAPLPDIENTERFLKVLKGFTFLSSEQKEEIRKEIPENVKLDTEKAHKLINSVHEGFSLNIEDKNAPELQISYLSNTKRNNIFYFYESRKRDEILSELESTNPIAELEEIFSKNSVDKKKCETMCEVMQFSEETKTILRKLVAGQIKKNPENNLQNLLNRIQLLKKILIEEKGEIHHLWLEVKRPTSKKHVVDKIIRHYLREPSLQAAVEMLLIDCMSIRGKKGWIKSSNLYCGINLRNILCHGNPFLDRLCELLAPEDLASELVKIMLRLIEDEDAIDAILDLYQRLNGDYSSFQNIINSDDTEEYRNLKDRILKCNEWKDYVVLLPSKRTPPANKT